MAKYRVLRPWFGVSVGQIVTLTEVHPALRANVVPVGENEPKESDAAVKTLSDARAEAEALRQKTEAELTQKIAEAIEGARAEAQSIIDSAKAEGQAIVDAARAEAESFIKGEVGEITPATPAATSDKPKATTKAK